MYHSNYFVISLHVTMGFPCVSDSKESICIEVDLGLIPGFGRFPGEGKVYPVQYSGFENSMDCIAHGVTKSQTLLSDFHFHFLFFFFNLTDFIKIYNIVI